MKKEMKEVEQQGQKSSLSNTIVWLIVIIILLIAGYFAWQYWQNKEQAQETEIEAGQALVLEPEIELSHLSKIGPTKGVFWARQLDLLWNNIENIQGTFDWDMLDSTIKEFATAEVYPLIIVKPFANWDQEACHPDKIYDVEIPKEMGGKLKVGVPCDMTAYSEFLKKAVERYDGDGIDDMPGLVNPIKYWEIMNEPVMQGGLEGGMGEDLKFFVGTSDEYLEILKTSYQAIKEIDSDAYVVQGGMAGMQKEVQDFWAPIMDKDGGDYFDIANNHTISTESDREDLYMVKLNKWLKSYDVDDKDVWITEVQYGSLIDKPSNLEELDNLMVRSTVFSLALGADKLFYIQNWLNWDSGWDSPKPGEEEGEKPKPEDGRIKEFTEIADSVKNSSTHKTYLNLVDKINNFDTVKTIKQEYTENKEPHAGVTSKIGQYKFINGSKVVYVFWGKSSLPEEITTKDKYTVTDIYGESQEMTKKQIQKALSNSPIFVEILSE